ncbi:MAG: lysophospholipid acyltransferase family protein [Deltaproteobacteria bacterium]|nr:lysophospholipid acyltransferase family protein [Deltaproteobacteria bacterium]MBW1934951.1 lysophospholipid acyltransferase family protein [Deltaproteobacteria bacterium]MBW1976817.1 lysophospholipid acyltransferase family protein [Deltaproteobacteria bacterium]MBW2043742.1 lysophospholipid acyltransferase family protein [Deltaproteobacteria bacterium]MBW2299906.1 lysophospholipid acyltransferase family protein [Deltaproteobacteria bacterium]
MKDQFRWYDPILLRIIPPLAALLIKMLMLSCRVVRTEGLDREKDALFRAGGKALYVTWHQRMSYHFHFAGPRHLTMMISQSRDGEYAARVASLLGFNFVRGSSTRGGTKVLREMIKRIREGNKGGVLADGPQGPPRVAKLGPVFIARDAGAPLIPILWGAKKCWVLDSWDRYLVPKPFTKVAIFVAEPIWVPATAKGDELERYRQLLEKKLNEGTRWCDEQFGAERPWRKAPDKSTPEIGPL